MDGGAVFIDWSGKGVPYLWRAGSLTQLRSDSVRGGWARDFASRLAVRHYVVVMQLSEQPPPPLTTLWDRILRARALPPDLDVQLLYVAIRDRLTHPEWEVRLHALRVLADLLPISGNALAFPFDQVVDNLGHNSPNVRKAALDAVKVFCSHCEDPECAARAIIDKCSYDNIRPHSANLDAKTNVITGLILSIPSVFGILRRRNVKLDLYSMFVMLGEKLYDPYHRDVALRSLIKLRRICGPRDYMANLRQLDPKVQEKFRVLCELYDEDSQDVYYPSRKSVHRTSALVKTNLFSSTASTPLTISTDSSSDESLMHVYQNNFGKVIIETEIKFDSNTAITMTVLEENETEDDNYRNIASEDDCDSSDQIMLKYNEGDSEDTDVVVKKVRFGGESIKIRTPDSENQHTSEDDNRCDLKQKEDNIKEVTQLVTPVIVSKMIELKNEDTEKQMQTAKLKKSGIPLPVINVKNRFVQSVPLAPKLKPMKHKSKSLNELYDYFRAKNSISKDQYKDESRFALTLVEARSPEKVPSPIEFHREVEVLHNLQRSPNISPRRNRTRFIQLEPEGTVFNILQRDEPSLLAPRDATLAMKYDWEDLNIVPEHIMDQLHNQENWISAVKAADQLHSALLDKETVRRIEPVAALSLVQHMWALSEAVSASKVPAEGAVCALFRNASSDCARQLLPALVSRMARDPLPAALPHALLQRLALHHLVDLIFDPKMIGVSGDTEKVQKAQLRATLCLARAAGPAAVLSAVRRRLAGTARADVFCQKLRESLNRPIKDVKASQKTIRSSQLPVPVRRRARSTPPLAAPIPPRRLRPLPDSAPLPGISVPKNYSILKTLTPIHQTPVDSSATTGSIENEKLKKAEGDANLKSSVTETTEVIPLVDIVVDEPTPPTPPRSPSIFIEDFTDKVNSEDNVDHHNGQENHEEQINKTLEETENRVFGDADLFALHNLNVKSTESPMRRSPSRLDSRRSSINSIRSHRSAFSSPVRSLNNTPAPASEPYDEQVSPSERDVRRALSECITPTRHEDWEIILSRLQEIERLACDPTARAPATYWRAVVRSTAGHVRSLRSRVARTACSTLGKVFEHRGRALDPELDEATGALLERCADVNRFLRADAAAALVQVAKGGSSSRSVAALSRRGANHRAGPVRAAATQALAKLVSHHTPSKILDLPPEPRTLLLRAAGELLGDANAETREHARLLCLTLSEDSRFQPMIKESMTQSRYRTIEKYVEKLRCS